MAVRQFREQDTRPGDSMSVLDGSHRTTARELLIPRIVERNQQAILGDGREFHLYVKRLRGRRCSCFGPETTPDGSCRVCYQSGIVGGFDKFGFATEVIDVTYPNVAAVNVRPAFEKALRPVLWQLDDGALLGYLEAKIPIRPNRRYVDLVQMISKIETGAAVKLYCRLPSEQSYVELNGRTFCERLSGTEMIVRLVFSRTSTEVAVPYVSHLALRYAVTDVDRSIVKIDINREEQSVILEDIGVQGTFRTITGWLPGGGNSPANLTTNDFFRRKSDGVLWKVSSVQPNRPHGISTSFDLVLRDIKDFESQYVNVP